MTYQTKLIRTRQLIVMLTESRLLKELGWSYDGSLRQEGSYYYQNMKKLTGCHETDWEV